MPRRSTLPGLLLTLAAAFLTPAAVPAAQPRALPERPTVAEILDPDVAYQADYTLRTPTQRFAGRVYHDGRRERREWSDRSGSYALLVRRDIDAVYVVFPQYGFYLSTTYKGMGGLIGDPENLVLDMTPTGSERVAERPARRYDVRGVSGSGGRLVGTVWLSPENVLVRSRGTVRFAGRDESFESELSNLAFGPLDPALFEPPTNFVRITLDAFVAPQNIPYLVDSLRRSYGQTPPKQKN
jgi:hypothetical protein